MFPRAAGLPISMILSPGLSNWPRMACHLLDFTNVYSESSCLSRIKARSACLAGFADVRALRDLITTCSTSLHFHVTAWGSDLSKDTQQAGFPSTAQAAFLSIPGPGQLHKVTQLSLSKSPLCRSCAKDSALVFHLILKTAI